MRGVPLFSPAGYALVNRGPAWREHPDYHREDPPEDEGTAQYLDFVDSIAAGDDTAPNQNQEN